MNQEEDSLHILDQHTQRQQHSIIFVIIIVTLRHLQIDVSNHIQLNVNSICTPVILVLYIITKLYIRSISHTYLNANNLCSCYRTYLSMVSIAKYCSCVFFDAFVLRMFSMATFTM